MSPDNIHKARSPQEANTFTSQGSEHELESGAAPASPSLLRHATIQRALASPRALSPADVLQLQRTIGNHAVQRILNPAPQPVASPRPGPLGRLQHIQRALADEAAQEAEPNDGSEPGESQLQPRVQNKAANPTPGLTIQ